MLPPQSTTLLAVRANGEVAVGSDGQATAGGRIASARMRKVHRLADANDVVAAGTGSTPLTNKVIEMVNDGLKVRDQDLGEVLANVSRTWVDKHHELVDYTNATFSVLFADKKATYTFYFDGTVAKAEGDVAADGAGEAWAEAAAAAIRSNAPDKGAEEVVREAIAIAASRCIYTNDNIHVEVI